MASKDNIIFCLKITQNAVLGMYWELSVSVFVT